MKVGLALALPQLLNFVALASESSTEALSQLNPNVYTDSNRDQLADMVRSDLRRRLQEANDRSRQTWHKIKTKEDWETFRDERLKALRHSLGQWPEPPEKLNVRVTGRIDGDGFRIENVLFESRPGLWVTANLYLPAEPPESMPGILICHSHHRPKEHGELQDMGMTWARAGCAVLVMDQLGHGERRQHPFATADDFPREFRASRQDYYFRYDTGIQLHLIGESLVGWMAWDMMRGVDLLLSRPNVDPKRMILLGAVAGGGDPAAVTAALDERITCAVPFNFGGPQPETRYPLPEDAETSFNYAGSGSWESTRNLRLSAQDGFLPWVIVGGIAPRRLVFAHEFNWHRERDPVWKRLQAIYEFYEQPDLLAFTHGRGELRGQQPEATHCTHIGKFHRQLIHEAFDRWFGIKVSEQDEYSNRRDESELRCMTPEAARELKPKRLVELLPVLAADRLIAARDGRAKLSADERRRKLRQDLAGVLGTVESSQKPKVIVQRVAQDEVPGAVVERLALEVEPDIRVPVLLFSPTDKPQAKRPVVIALAQAGKRGFLQHRSEELAKLIAAGATVCLPDVRGTGETRSGDGRGRQTADTSRSSTELMLGGTTLGARLRDVRQVLGYLRTRPDVDPHRIAVWGDSFADANPTDADFKIPRGLDRPAQSEPLGGLLALLAALYEPDVTAVYMHGGLAEIRSVVSRQFVYVPHDVVVPGMLTVADLSVIAGTVAPRPLCFEGLVDGWNRRVDRKTALSIYEPAVRANRDGNSADRLVVASERTSAAEWLIPHLFRESN